MPEVARSQELSSTDSHTPILHSSQNYQNRAISFLHFNVHPVPAHTFTTTRFLSPSLLSRQPILHPAAQFRRTSPLYHTFARTYTHIPTMQNFHTSSSNFQFRKYNNWRIESVYNPFHNRENSSKWHQNDAQSLRNAHQYTLVTHHVKSSIDLSDLETKMFDFLMDMQKWCDKVADGMDPNSEDTALLRRIAATSPRVAGGWCRDLLMGMDSLDIDIALDLVDGEQYCNAIVQYQKEMGMETRSIGVIVENPDQSKHLKTATTHIFGVSVDFVNLRSEEYTSNSRIPTVRYGTPEEDAHRRDLTINALFYNLRTKQVEDFVKTGYTDLKHGIIRTPLPSHQTFLDDPLRVIRAVRMAARFHFLVSDELMDAAMQTEIHEALHSKISRERVGIELHKILKNGDPAGAFACFREMNVANVIFTCVQPVKGKNLFEYVNPVPVVWSDAEWDNSLFRMRTVLHLAKAYELDSDSSVALSLAAFLSTIAPEADRKDVLGAWVDSLIMISWRLPRKLSNAVTDLIHSARQLHPYIINENTKNLDVQSLRSYYEILVNKERVSLGTWIRAFSGDYRSACFLSSLLHTRGNEFNEQPYVQGKLNHGELFLEAINNSVLLEIRGMEQLLNGKEIMQLLGVKRGGKFMTAIVEQYMRWQIASWPCTKENAIQYMKEHAHEFELHHD